MLWSGPELRLACERIIPYPDGFEIELRRSGGMSPPAVPAGTLLPQPRQHDPWERPDKFIGLQMSLTFANGLHVLRDDLGSPDRQDILPSSSAASGGERLTRTRFGSG
jgi:hypothetical protein